MAIGGATRPGGGVASTVGAAAGGGLNCRVVERLEELREYRQDWRSLAAACGHPTCRPEWLEAWWRVRCEPADGDSRALRVAVVTDHGRLVGLLPTYVVNRAMAFPDLRLLGQPSFWRLGLLLSDEAPERLFR